MHSEQTDSSYRSSPVVIPGKFSQLATRLFHSIAFSGLRDVRNIEAQRQVLVINLYCFVGVLYLTLFAMQSVTEQRWELAAILGGCSLFGLSNLLYLRFTGDYERAGDGIIMVASGLCLYLIVTGGIENTGPLWSYTLPPLVLFIYGLSKGGLVLSGFMLACIGILYIPDNGILIADYSFEFKSRYNATFLVVCFISSICEYARFHSYGLLQKLQQKIQLEARTDELTGLYNRRHMYEQINRELRKIQRYDRPYSLMLCDIDHFKAINDDYGHPCGDQVLIEVARRMEKSMRVEDTVARWGGEEFLILMPETEIEAATLAAEKLRRQIGEIPVHTHNQTLNVTMSIGVAQVHMECDIESILKKVDEALYTAKRNGRNRIEVHRF